MTPASIRLPAEPFAKMISGYFSSAIISATDSLSSLPPIGRSVFNLTPVASVIANATGSVQGSSWFASALKKVSSITSPDSALSPSLLLSSPDVAPSVVAAESPPPQPVSVPAAIAAASSNAKTFLFFILLLPSVSLELT